MRCGSKNMLQYKSSKQTHFCLKKTSCHIKKSCPRDLILTAIISLGSEFVRPTLEPIGTGSGFQNSLFSIPLSPSLSLSLFSPQSPKKPLPHPLPAHTRHDQKDT